MGLVSQQFSRPALIGTALSIPLTKGREAHVISSMTSSENPRRWISTPHPLTTSQIAWRTKNLVFSLDTIFLGIPTHLTPGSFRRVAAHVTYSSKVLP